MSKFDEFYDLLVDHNVATEDEISLVCCVNGYSVESLEGILYARLGLRSLEQWQEVELHDMMHENGFEWCYDKQEYVPMGDGKPWVPHHVGCNCYNCL